MTSAPAWPAGYALRHFEVIDSTNEEARRLANAGERRPTWIAADQQTSGRGRRGRSWDSPTGNLSATLFLRPERPIAECAQLSFVAAVSAADMIARFAGNAAIKVKWPNDVLADGRKIAGILLESASAGGDRLDWLAIGIGANLAEHPEGTEFPATSLAALGVKPPPPGESLTFLAAAWAKWYDIWAASGFAEIRDAWLVRAAGLGTRIRARLQNEETAGVFEGIDTSGALLLRESQDRLRTISAGEVFF